MTETNKQHQLPLISIIIPCYNHGMFLRESLISIANVNYPHIETILIDDGSTDNTSDIAQSFPWVKYIYQSNQGLPSSRNKGILLSRGEFLLFLDADDLLYPDGLKASVDMLLAENELVFVSGCHNVIDKSGAILDDASDNVDHDHYIDLLGRNYIGNPGTVLYRRRVLDEFQFENALDIKGCEDYDLYLKITRKYPVRHHIDKVTAYRKHSSNMSDNYPMMLTSVLNVLKKQQPLLRNETERAAWISGMKNWKRKYLIKIIEKGFRHMNTEERRILISHMLFLFKHYWSGIKIRLREKLRASSFE